MSDEAETPARQHITSSPMSEELRRLAQGEDGARLSRAFLLKAADEIDDLRDALFWCGGSPSFAPEGEAHVGWMKVVAPLMK